MASRLLVEHSWLYGRYFVADANSSSHRMHFKMVSEGGNPDELPAAARGLKQDTTAAHRCSHARRHFEALHAVNPEIEAPRRLRHTQFAPIDEYPQTLPKGPRTVRARVQSSYRCVEVRRYSCMYTVSLFSTRKNINKSKTVTQCD